MDVACHEHPSIPHTQLLRDLAVAILTTHTKPRRRRLITSTDVSLRVAMQNMDWANMIDRPLAPKGKGMQLGKKSKTTDMFERVRGDMGGDVDDSPLVPPAPVAAAESAEPRISSTFDRDAVHVTISESISANLSREGAVNSLSISGDLALRISDPNLTKIKLGLQAIPSHGAQFRTHPNVDRNLFNSSKTIQMSNAARGFPVNNAVAVLRWRASPKVEDNSACPITFTVWINNNDGKFNVTVEYELTGGDGLKDVSVVIPYSGSEPVVSSFDAAYKVSGDILEWNIGSVDDENPNGSFEFEAESSDENDFFPMTVRFSKTTPYVNVDVSSRAPPTREMTFRQQANDGWFRLPRCLFWKRTKKLHSRRKSSPTRKTTQSSRVVARSRGGYNV